MHTKVRLAAVLLILAVGRIAWGDEKATTVEPDFAAMQTVALDQIASVRKLLAWDADDRVHIRQVSCEEELLPRDNHRKSRPVYLLRVQEVAEPAKEGLWYVMVLKPDGKTFLPLLVYVGGFDSPVNARAIELDAYQEFREDPRSTATAYPFHDLLVEDTASPNGTSMTRVLLFHYDEALGYFRNIFDECLTYTHLFERPYDSFESTLAFPDKNTSGMRDLVITTDWWVQEWEAAYEVGEKAEAEKEAAIKAGKLERRITVIRWDGKRYSGGLDYSKGAEPIHPDRKWWLPEMTPVLQKADPDASKK